MEIRKKNIGSMAENPETFQTEAEDTAAKFIELTELNHTSKNCL